MARITEIQKDNINYIIRDYPDEKFYVLLEDTREPRGLVRVQSIISGLALFIRPNGERLTWRAPDESEYKYQ